jgi:WD40 repeat protein
MIYAAEFSKGSNTYIAAGGGGSGANEIRLFDTKQDYKCVAMVENCISSYFTLALSSNGRMLAAGGGSKTIYVYDIDPSVGVDFPY